MSMKLFHRLHKVNLVTSTIIETIDDEDYDLTAVRVGQQQEKSFEAPNSSGSLSTKASSATNFDAVIIMILLLLLLLLPLCLLLLLLNNTLINMTIMVVARKSMGPGSQLSVDLERGIVLLTVF